MNEYVGVRAASFAMDRPLYWIRKAVSDELVVDNRATKGKGLRLAFGVYEFYQLTALVALWTNIKPISTVPEVWPEFMVAFDEYLFKEFKEPQDEEYNLVHTKEGLKISWDFQRLELVGAANYAMALKLENPSSRLYTSQQYAAL